MIKTQIIKQSNKPIAVILDFEEFTRLKNIEYDKTDYISAMEVKRTNKKWKSHAALLKELGI